MANGNKKKSRKKLFIFGGIGALLLVLVLLLAFSGNKEEIIAVQTEVVQKRTITQVVAATGKINPEFQVIITPEVTGEIVELPVKEGDRVRKGQLLIRIKPDTYVAAKDRAQASLESAKAGLSRSKAIVDRVKSEFDRVQELYKKGLSSDQELETARSGYLTAKSDYESQQGYVEQVRASLKEANENLNKTAIYSPIDGTVSQLNVELGERVLGSFYSQGTNIMTVADLSKMEATVEVDENDVVLVSVGDTAKITVDAYGEKEFTGIVSQIGNSAKTEAAGTQQEVVNFEIKISLLNVQKENLRPGMSCNADIKTETVNNVYAVPIQSVTARSKNAMPAQAEGGDEEEMNREQQRPKSAVPDEVVFLVKNNKAKMVKVTTGISDDSYIEVKSGLAGGENVVSGSYRAISRELKENVNVRVEGGRVGAGKKKTS